MTVSPPSTPLVRLVAVDEIPPAGLPLTIVATAPERAAVASFNGLAGLGALTAELMLRHEPRGGIHVTGSVTAEITQTCVVTLEPFDSSTREAVDVHFLPTAALEDLHAARRRSPAPAEDDDEEDEPDLIEHGRIDIGGLVAEHLTLGLDPYPRKSDATLDAVLPPEEPRTSPFAVLRGRDEDKS